MKYADFCDAVSFESHKGLDCVSEASEILADLLRQKACLHLFGNGGSHSIVSHMATDFYNILGLNCEVMSDANQVTCFANDFGYEEVFLRVIKRRYRSGDGVLLVSSSGESENIIAVSRWCQGNDVPLITCSGFEATNRLRSMGKVNFWVDSSNYNVIEMAHHVWLCGLVETMRNR